MAMARHGLTATGQPRQRPFTPYEAFVKTLPSDMSKEQKLAKWKDHQAASDENHRSEICSMVLERVNVNTCTREQLIKVPHLTLAQVNAIWKKREEGTVFRTLDDLKHVQGVGPKTVKSILPFVACGQEPSQGRS